jgi:DNA mismatch repair protein MutS
MAEASSPMMRQYYRIKASHPDAILFFRLGDFYEMFFEDAELASGVLDITLTARNRGTRSEAPMCGVPHHSADGYLARLLEAGHKVAIAEQVEDAAQAKGMVRREVVRVLTPGTLVEDDLLDSRDNNYVIAVSERSEKVGIAVLDVSTGEFIVAEFNGESPRVRAREEVGRWAPSEVCHPQSDSPATWLVPEERGLPSVRGVRTWSPLSDWNFDSDRARASLCEHFGVSSLGGFDLAGCDVGVASAGALLRYASEESHRAPLRHVRSIRRYRDREVLQLDDATRRSLELTTSWQQGGREGSLLAVIDRSATAMGGRRLRQWLLRPLRDPEAIGARLEVVDRLVSATRRRDAVREALHAVHDLERLTTRISIGSASPRDLYALRTSLEALPAVVDGLGELADTQLGGRLADRLDRCEDVIAMVADRLADEPPASLSAGAVIREGCDERLDSLRRARAEGKGFIASLESTERERTGISSLKVRFNKVFGYFIEVSKSNLAKVPEHYHRKQTLTNAERFITPELKEFEETVLGAEDKIAALEQQLFSALRQEVAAEAERLRRTAEVLATFDALAGLADVASRAGWVRPVVDDALILEIRAGRHPVVEALQPDVRFVPNDAYLDGGQHRIKLVTGPNMGGKSTYLRQVALIVILAQMGSFVPAEGARVGIVDRVFTRVGASDNLARGASTFLIEMQETANILNNATPRSLILLDEVGRGTSTYDGLSIAWAVVEHLHDTVELASRTLFATHYHELTELEERLAGLTNLSVVVHESAAEVVFLHRVEPGAADRSYGIHVGRLAGLPLAVVLRAEEILAELEGHEKGLPGLPESAVDASQMRLFMPEHPMVGKLRQLQPCSMTPLEALEHLTRWKQQFGTDESVE